MEPFPDPAWKKDALTATCRELPRIRCTGLEVGPVHGLGSMIYGDENERANNASGGGGPGMRRSRSWGGVGGMGGEGGDEDVFAAAARLRKDGKWLGELDVRLQVLTENPLLKRYSEQRTVEKSTGGVQHDWSDELEYGIFEGLLRRMLALGSLRNHVVQDAMTLLGVSNCRLSLSCFF